MMQGQQDEKFEKQRPPAFLCVATEWDSGHGGISTFNRELCIALANAGSPCYCLVPELDEGQRQEAERYGVVLLAPKARVGLNSESALLGKIKLPPDLGPFWVVGHDRITGPAAAARLDESIYAGFIFVVHTIPEEIEWLKAEKDRDAARESEQRSELHLELARQAKLIVAVGPRIFARTEWLLKSEKSPPALMRLDPGLAAFNDPGSPAKKRSCLLLGRADDFNLKGLDIAAKALGRIDQHVTLVIRGAEAGKGADLKRKLDELANNPKIAIQPQEYSSDKHKISADLRRSTMVLMPSRKEGFGLVGLEAIAAGIPVLISSESGLADLLQELAPDNKVIVPVKDKTDQDAEAWSRKVDFILEDTEAAFSRARKLYEQLAQHLTWPKAIRKLLSSLPEDPANTQLHAESNHPVHKLVASKLSEHLSKPCWVPFLKTLHKSMTDKIEEGDLALPLAYLLIEQDILDVPALISNSLSNSMDCQAARLAWEDGMNLMGWLVIAGVDESCCLDLSKHNIFHLPLKTLIGVEVVLSWQGQRQAYFKEGNREVISQLGMDVAVEAGPNAFDYVAEIATQLCELFGHKVPKPWSEDNLKMINAMIRGRGKRGKPIYFPVSIDDKLHPLNVDSTKKAIQCHFPHLMLVYFEPTKAGKMRVLLMDEHELKGSLWDYIKAKQEWLMETLRENPKC